jgi:hypothetical protein
MQVTLQTTAQHRANQIIKNSVCSIEWNSECISIVNLSEDELEKLKITDPTIIVLNTSNHESVGNEVKKEEKTTVIIPPTPPTPPSKDEVIGNEVKKEEGEKVIITEAEKEAVITEMKKMTLGQMADLAKEFPETEWIGFKEKKPFIEYLLAKEN